MDISLPFENAETATRVASYLQSKDVGNFTIEGSTVQCQWRAEADMTRLVAQLLEEHVSFSQLITQHDRTGQKGNTRPLASFLLIFSLLTVGQRARFHLPWRLGARGSSSCSP